MSGPAILVTGGAGYIGSHTCRSLAASGFTPVVYDDLSSGRQAFVRWGPFEQGDIRDAARVEAVFRAHRPVAVIHFAALIDVAESVREPDRYHDVNVYGASVVLDAAIRAGAAGIVFSSTCATYGEPQRIPLVEDHPQAPINPYGETKLKVERMLAEADRRGEMRHVILRYFNAAGGAPEAGIGEQHDPETHAIPLALAAAAGHSAGFSIFGTDYATRDGTAERDYVDVIDLANAHVRALRWLLADKPSRAFNVGSGRGTTVAELIESVARVTGRTPHVTTAPRRPGDAPALVADPGRIAAELGWTATRDLDQMIAAAWDWYRAEHGVADMTEAAAMLPPEAAPALAAC